MITVNMHEAKTNLSKLIALLGQEEEVVIAKSGLPVAKLVSYQTPSSPRQANLFKDKIRYHDDFESSNETITELFE